MWTHGTPDKFTISLAGDPYAGRPTFLEPFTLFSTQLGGHCAPCSWFNLYDLGQSRRVLSTFVQNQNWYVSSEGWVIRPTSQPKTANHSQTCNPNRLGFRGWRRAARRRTTPTPLATCGWGITLSLVIVFFHGCTIRVPMSCTSHSQYAYPRTHVVPKYYIHKTNESFKNASLSNGTLLLSSPSMMGDTFLLECVCVLRTLIATMLSSSQDKFS